jgi:hypothetical protein
MADGRLKNQEWENSILHGKIKKLLIAKTKIDRKIFYYPSSTSLGFL